MMRLLEFLYTSTVLKWLRESLWRDEAFSVLLARRDFIEIIYLAAKDYTPPLYYLILKTWMIFFGDSEIIIRSLSLVFYFLSLIVFFLILERVKMKQIFMYLALVVFATVPGFLYYAFEARPYAMLTLFSLASFYTLLTNRPKINFFFNILGFFTHYFFLFVFLVQGVYLLADRKLFSLFRRYIYIFGLIIFIWFVFLVYIKSYILSSSFWIEKISLQDIWRSFFIIWTGYIQGWEEQPKFFNLFSILFFIIFFAHLLYFLRIYKKHLLKQQNMRRFFLVVFLWAFAPVFIGIFVSFFKSVFIPRYFIFVLPAFVYIFLIGFSRKKSTKISLFLLTALLFLNLYYLDFLIEKRKRFDWKKVLSERRLTIEDKEYIFLLDASEYPIFVYYLPDLKEKIRIWQDYENIPPYVGKVIYPKYSEEDLFGTEYIFFRSNGRIYFMKIN